MANEIEELSIEVKMLWHVSGSPCLDHFCMGKSAACTAFPGHAAGCSATPQLLQSPLLAWHLWL